MVVNTLNFVLLVIECSDMILSVEVNGKVSKTRRGNCNVESVK